MKRVMLFGMFVIVVLHFSLATVPKRNVQAQNLSLAWPVKNHVVTQLYSSGHPALDIIDPQNRINPLIYAAGDGVVKHVGYRSSDPQGGYQITIHHDTMAGGQYYTWYAHLANNSAVVSVGQKVSKGQHIATMGNTSSIQGLAVHLHFVLNTNGSLILNGTVDPLPYLTSGPPAPPPPPPVSQVPSISQVGRIVMNDPSPAIGGTVRFDVTVKNNSPFPAELKEVFLRIIHVATGTEKKVTLWAGNQPQLVIPANGTWQFRVFSPPMDKQGAWQVHKVEMLHHPTGGKATWLQGIDQQTYFVAGRTNVARNRPVTVHSIRAGSGNVPTYLVDGNMLTRFESAWYDDQVILIDLGAGKQIDSILLYWETAYAKEFAIRINTNNCGSNKDACTWKEIYSTTNGQYKTYLVSFDRKEVRWINIWLKKRGTPWGFSLWEVTAY